MFPQFSPGNGPQTGNGYTTSAMVQQSNGLLGQSPFQTQMNMPSIHNSTAPMSSTTNPGVMNMVKALKGGV